MASLKQFILFLYPIILTINSIGASSSNKVSNKEAQYNGVDRSEHMDNYIQPRALTYTYYGNDTETSWLDAFTNCGTLESKLASPYNPTSDNSLRLFMVGQVITNAFWIGGRVSLPDDLGNTKWWWETYNRPFLHTNFHTDVDCGTNETGYCLAAYIKNESGQWGWCSRNCSENLPFVCESGTPPLEPITSTTETESEATTLADRSTTSGVYRTSIYIGFTKFVLMTFSAYYCLVV